MSRTPTLITGNLQGVAGNLVSVWDTALVTLGWSIAASSGNERIYAPGSGGTGLRLYVDDRGLVTGGAREAVVRLCDPSSTIGALVNPSPSVAQQADNNCVLRKSNTLDTTNRPYEMVGDSRFFCIRILSNTTIPDFHVFGDLFGGSTGDGYNAIITQRGTANSTTAGLSWASSIAANFSLASGLGRCNLARSINGLVISDIAGIVTAGGSWASSLGTYPHPQDNKIRYSAAGVVSSGSNTATTGTGGGPRGVVPFLFEPHISSSNPGTIVTGDTWTDSAYDASSQFLATTATTGLTWTTAGAIILQTAGTWDPDAMRRM